MFSKCIHGAGARFQLTSYTVLASYFFKGTAEYFAFRYLWNYTDAIDIPENDVTGGDANAPDLDWHAKIVDFISRRGILSVRPKGEGGEGHL